MGMCGLLRSIFIMSSVREKFKKVRTKIKSKINELKMKTGGRRKMKAKISVEKK